MGRDGALRAQILGLHMMSRLFSFTACKAVAGTPIRAIPLSGDSALPCSPSLPVSNYCQLTRTRRRLYRLGGDAWTDHRELLHPIDSRYLSENEYVIMAHSKH